MHSDDCEGYQLIGLRPVARSTGRPDSPVLDAVNVDRREAFERLDRIDAFHIEEPLHVVEDWPRPGLCRVDLADDLNESLMRLAKRIEERAVGISDHVGCPLNLTIARHGTGPREFPR